MERKAFCSLRLPNVVRNYTFTGMEAVKFSRVEVETWTLKTTEGIHKVSFYSIFMQRILTLKLRGMFMEILLI